MITFWNLFLVIVALGIMIALNMVTFMVVSIEVAKKANMRNRFISGFILKTSQIALLILLGAIDIVASTYILNCLI